MLWFRQAAFSLGTATDIVTSRPRCCLSLQAAHEGRMFIWWRPDQRLVKYVIFEQQPSTTPSDPPENPAAGAVTTGGAIKPLPEP
jgi:hypothetical protein